MAGWHAGPTRGTERIDATYDEHAQIPRNAMQRRLDQAGLLLRNHIEMSKAVVRQITVHRLHSARTSLSRDAITQRRTA